jgi:hypothetical protein
MVLSLAREVRKHEIQAVLPRDSMISRCNSIAVGRIGIPIDYDRSIMVFVWRYQPDTSGWPVIKTTTQPEIGQSTVTRRRVMVKGVTKYIENMTCKRQLNLGFTVLANTVQARLRQFP